MYYERQTLIDRIKSQPTAYDVYKVVEQIKALSPANYVTKDDVLKIVKGGGAKWDFMELEADETICQG